MFQSFHLCTTLKVDFNQTGQLVYYTFLAACSFHSYTVLYYLKLIGHGAAVTNNAYYSQDTTNHELQLPMSDRT